MATTFSEGFFVNLFNSEELMGLWDGVNSGEVGEEFHESKIVADEMSTTDYRNDSLSGQCSSPGAHTKKRRTYTPAQRIMRRKRNRDSMRRVRQRKQVEFAILRKKIELLEAKLQELHALRSDHMSSLVLCSSDVKKACIPVRQPRSNVNVEAILEEIKRLQSEQVCLTNAILSHQEVSATLAQIMDESTDTLGAYSETVSENPSNWIMNLDATSQDFQWVHDVLPLLPTISRAHVQELIRESYLDILDRVDYADSGDKRSADPAFGWSDRRSVEGNWADFCFGKDFEHEHMDALVAKTWSILTSADYQQQHHDDFHSKKLQIKILEQLSEDAYLVARNSLFPVDGHYYSSIYVLFRVKTAHGYLIGGRTICTPPGNSLVIDGCLDANRSYLHMYCAMIFSQPSSK
uniref:BZIP domain-containing protein n=1 Tax=Globisporangium ultimum (strain ATCC 200006 / CBS 805.95 / DAOM BR144) TaxID=431595 RepID=K3WXF5_GLOUD